MPTTSGLKLVERKGARRSRVASSRSSRLDDKRDPHQFVLGEGRQVRLRCVEPYADDREVALASVDL